MIPGLFFGPGEMCEIRGRARKVNISQDHYLARFYSLSRPERSENVFVVLQPPHRLAVLTELSQKKWGNSSRKNTA
jgi:hypothetical protein